MDSCKKCDERTKKNIQLLQKEDSLKKVLQMVGYSFEYIGDERERIGFIAQELERIEPKLVYHDPNGLLSVDFNALFPMIVQAVQETQRQIIEMSKNQDFKKLEKEMNNLTLEMEKVVNSLNELSVIKQEQENMKNQLNLLASKVELLQVGKVDAKVQEQAQFTLSNLDEQILEVLMAASEPLIAKEVSRECRKRLGSKEPSTKQANQILYKKLLPAKKVEMIEGAKPKWRALR